MTAQTTMEANVYISAIQRQQMSNAEYDMVQDILSQWPDMSITDALQDARELLREA